jgi:hypothetical protein
MRYQNVPPISRNEARAAFRSGSEAAIRAALLSITYHDEDWRWIQEQLLRFARHRNSSIRSLAGLCFGHVARIHRALDLDAVLPVLSELARDPETRGHAEDALADIAIFIPSA